MIARRRVAPTARDGTKARISIVNDHQRLRRHPLESLKGGDARRNAAMIREVLDGERGAHRDAVILNAAAALVVHGKAADLRQGAELAAESIDTRLARRTLELLQA